MRHTILVLTGRALQHQEFPTVAARHIVGVVFPATRGDHPYRRLVGTSAGPRKWAKSSGLRHGRFGPHGGRIYGPGALSPRLTNSMANSLTQSVRLGEALPPDGIPQ